MPHESTVNPYDYMGDDMNNMVNRISRGSSLLNVDTTSTTNLSAPGQEVNKLTQDAVNKLNDFCELKTPHSPVTDKNKQLYYGSQSVTPSSVKMNKRDSVTDQLIKPETPSELTHYEEFDDDDEESDESKSVENATSV